VEARPFPKISYANLANYPDLSGLIQLAPSPEYEAGGIEVEDCKGATGSMEPN
jgi:hypothetical protein